MKVEGFGFWVLGFVFRVWVFGFRSQVQDFEVSGSGFRVRAPDSPLLALSTGVQRYLKFENPRTPRSLRLASFWGPGVFLGWMGVNP